MKGKDCQNRYSTFASNLCPSSQLASPIPTGTYPIIRPQGPGPQPLQTLLRLSSYIFQAKISYTYTSGAIHKRLKICSEYIVGGCGTPVSSRTFALLPKWRNPERSRWSILQAKKYCHRRISWAYDWDTLGSCLSLYNRKRRALLAYTPYKEQMLITS